MFIEAHAVAGSSLGAMRNANAVPMSFATASLEYGELGHSAAMSAMARIPTSFSVSVNAPRLELLQASPGRK
jgi:hypothetical protein